MAEESVSQGSQRTVLSHIHICNLITAVFNSDWQ